MLPTRRVFAVLAVVLFLLTTPTLAQDTSEDPITALRAGIRRANASLEDIARSLQSLRVEQQALLMIRRVELEEKRLAPLSDAVRSARGNVERMEQEIRHLEAMREEFEREIDEAVRGGADPLSLPERGEIRQIDMVLELNRAELVTAQSRVIEAEDNLARRTRHMEVLDEKLDELLEALSD